MLPEELCSISPIGRLEMFRYITLSVCSVCVCVCHIRSSDRVEAVTVTVCGYLCNTACHTRPPSVVLYSPVLHLNELNYSALQAVNTSARSISAVDML